MEKFLKKEAGIQKVVGSTPENQKAVLDYFRVIFDKDFTQDFEKELDPEAREIILILNQKMKEFISKFAAQFLEIGPKKIHPLDKTKVSKEKLEELEKQFGELGAYLPYHQQIVILIDYSERKLKFMQTLVHEMLHGNSFQSVQILKNNSNNKGTDIVIEDDIEKQKVSLVPKRMGLKVRSKDLEEEYFHYFDEAVITELAMRFEETYFPEFPILAEERQKIIAELENLKSKGKDIEKTKGRIARAFRETNYDGSLTVVITPYGYEAPRRKLNQLIDELFEMHRNQFSSREDVFNLFAQAVLTGRLLPLARLIEGTYGKGYFRRLGEETKL